MDIIMNIVAWIFLFVFFGVIAFLFGSLQNYIKSTQDKPSDRQYDPIEPGR